MKRIWWRVDISQLRQDIVGVTAICSWDRAILVLKKNVKSLVRFRKFKGVLTISLVVGFPDDSLLKWGFDGWLFGFVEICRIDSVLFSMPVWCGTSAVVDTNLLPVDFRLSAEMAAAESRGLALVRVEVVGAVKPAASGFATWVLPDKYSALTEWYWICDTAGNRARCLWHDRSGRNQKHAFADWFDSPHQYHHYSFSLSISRRIWDSSWMYSNPSHISHFQWSCLGQFLMPHQRITTIPACLST